MHYACVARAVDLAARSGGCGNSRYARRQGSCTFRVILHQPTFQLPQAAKLGFAYPLCFTDKRAARGQLAEGHGHLPVHEDHVCLLYTSDAADE